MQPADQLKMDFGLERAKRIFAVQEARSTYIPSSTSPSLCVCWVKCCLVLKFASVQAVGRHVGRSEERTNIVGCPELYSIIELNV